MTRDKNKTYGETVKQNLRVTHDLFANVISLLLIKDRIALKISATLWWAKLKTTAILSLNVYSSCADKMRN